MMQARILLFVEGPVQANVHQRLWKKSIYHFKMWTLPGLYAMCGVTQIADLQHKTIFSNKL